MSDSHPITEEMLRFRLTHTGTSGGTVVSSGVLMNDDQVALNIRYGAHTDGQQLIIYPSIFDMIRSIGQHGPCTMEFIDPTEEI